MANKFKNMPTSKKLVWMLFLNVVVIETVAIFATVYSTLVMVETGITPDYTPLTTLIEAAITQVVAFGIYAIKSSMEKISLNKNGLRLNNNDEIEKIETETYEEETEEDNNALG